MGAAQSGRYRALLVANDHFPDDQANLPDLHGPGNDITYLSEALIDTSIGLFGASDVVALRDRPAQEFAVKLEQLCRSADRDDVLLVYYSGHGLIPDSGGALLLCGRDSRLDLALSTTVSSTLINLILGSSAAGTIVVVLDCCYSGRFPVKSGAAAAVVGGSGRYVLASCRPNEISFGGRSVAAPSTFTKHLIEGLREAPGRSGESYLMLDELYRFVYRRAVEADEPIPHQQGSGDGAVRIARRGTLRRKTPPRFVVSPAKIDVRGIRFGEQIPPKFVSVRVSSPGPDGWSARTVADWLTLAVADDHFYVHLSPRVGVNRADVDVLESDTGKVRTVSVRVDADPPHDPEILTGTGARKWATPTRLRTAADVAHRSYPVVAALEIGIHDSGIVWGDGQSAHHYVPNRWPGSAMPSQRVPTALLIDPHGVVVDWGFAARDRWQSELLPEGGRGFRYAAQFVPRSGAYDRLGRDPAWSQAYLTAYLKGLCAATRHDIRSAGWRDEDVRWCLTVPATWDDREWEELRKAAVDAGLPESRDQTLMVVGAEAAAYYASVHEHLDLSRPEVRLMIVQGGHATTDATSYVVSEADGRFQLIQVGRASGGFSASQQAIDEVLMDYLSNRFGGQRILHAAVASDPRRFREAVEQWTKEVGTLGVEPRPDGAPTYSRPHYIILPPAMRDAMRHEGGATVDRLDIAPHDIVEIWGTAVYNIVELIEDELAAAGWRDGDEQPTVFLVDELATNTYVVAYLTWALAGRAKVLASRMPRVSTLIGAIELAREPEVVGSARTGYAYGFSVALPFEEGVDPPQKRLLAHGGHAVCVDRFQVLIPKGHAVRQDWPPTVTLTPTRVDQSAINLTFYRSAAQEPRYVDDPGCEVVGTLTVELPLSDMPSAQREIRLETRLGEGVIVITAVRSDTGYEKSITLAAGAYY